MASRELVVTSSWAPFAQRIEAGPHAFPSDEPVASGGAETGPNPYDLLLAALGSCTSMTLELYARQKGWPLERARVQLSHSREHAQDCAECDGGARRLERIERRIQLTGPPDAPQRSRLLPIAEPRPRRQKLT